MLINFKKAFIIFSLLFILIMSLGAISASKDISDIGFDESNPESINSYCIVSDETNFINENNFENIIETDDKENKILKNSEKDSILSEDNPTNRITLNGGTFEDMQYIIDNAYENDTIIVNGTFIGNGIPINITKQVSINGIDEAIQVANDTEYGLQAGVFTSDYANAMRCAQEIEAGTVFINKQSTFRTDNMPFGGFKNSGVGKEGIKYAVEEMTKTKLIGLNLR